MLSPNKIQIEYLYTVVTYFYITSNMIFSNYIQNYRKVIRSLYSYSYIDCPAESLKKGLLTSLLIPEVVTNVSSDLLL